MTTTRRDFLDRLMVGGVGVGGLAMGLGVLPGVAEAMSPQLPAGSEEWDTNWPSRLTGDVRAVFDVPEIESGFGVWRATIWARQYEAVLGVPVAKTSTALVLRHNAVVLAMKQETWDRYGLASEAVTHPLTGAVTARNPALLGAADGVGEPYADFALNPFIARGGVALACSLALDAIVVPKIVARDGVSREEARARGIAGLVDGVILQPSGIFAALVAQQKRQALYIRAS